MNKNNTRYTKWYPWYMNNKYYLTRKRKYEMEYKVYKKKHTNFPVSVICLPILFQVFQTFVLPAVVCTATFRNMTSLTPRPYLSWSIFARTPSPSSPWPGNCTPALSTPPHATTSSKCSKRKDCWCVITLRFAKVTFFGSCLQTGQRSLFVIIRKIKKLIVIHVCWIPYLVMIL